MASTRWLNVIWRFLLTFLAAFRFRTAHAGDPLLGAIERLRTFSAGGRTILPRKAPSYAATPQGGDTRSWRIEAHRETVLALHEARRDITLDELRRELG